ncbi:MAG: hypothetical protein HY958_06015 [Bacteroidia bacterium]|nr:hypothetical protein [Bacteroidia bacterium]
MNDSFNHPGGKLRRQGANTCTNAELFAILLNTGTKNKTAVEVAQEMLDKFGSITNIMGHKMSELMEIEGIGPTKATQIAAFYELVSRVIRHIEAQ